MDLSERKATIVRELAAARDDLLAAVAAVPATEWDQASRNPGWSVRDVLTHLASGETSIQVFLGRLAAGGEGVPADFDLARFNAGQLRRREDRALSALLEELAAARTLTLDLLDQVSAAALERRGRHPTGREVSLEEAFHIVAAHEREHTRDLREALQPGAEDERNG